jgi:hypothetical protein
LKSPLLRTQGLRKQALFAGLEIGARESDLFIGTQKALRGAGLFVFVKRPIIQHKEKENTDRYFPTNLKENVNHHFYFRRSFIWRK